MQLTPKTEQQESRLEAIANSFLKVRKQTEFLVHGLSAEDQCVQAMADTSPTKWHLAPTTWFFETFILKPYLPAYEEFNTNFNFLFNSSTCSDPCARPLTNSSFCFLVSANCCF